ncbi:hypothetical protein CO151_02715 [bacterium CG_4_9_14_3_um_filter_65_15]|nr:MAG: hypothetical protein CO151_02715 [bacterium CG_4_9_14_3_um_filter_65_15]
MLGISPETGLTTPGQNTGITLRDVVFILFRRRWVILAISLPIILLGGTSLFRQTGSFTASARVLVELQKVDLPRWDSTGRSIDYDRELSTLYTIAMSNPVALRAAVTLQDSVGVMISLDDNLVDLAQDNNLSDFLLDGLDVSVIGESNILEFRFSSADPRISLMAVGALRDAFVEYQIHGRKDKRAVQFYTEQMNGVRSQIDSLLARRGQALMENQYISLTKDLDHVSGTLADLRNGLNKSWIDRKSLESKFNQLSKYLEEDPRNFPIGFEESRSQTLMYWRNQVSQHDDELARILTVYTKDSDVALRQQDLIRDSVERLSQEEAGFVQSIQVEIQGLKAREEAIRAQIDLLQAKTRNSPLLYQTVSLIDTEIESLRGLFDDIQGKLGEVRLNEFADERVSNVMALTSPQLSSILSGSKTIIYFILLVVFTIALGIVAAFVLDGLDHRVYDPKDVEDHLKLPVFASVTKVR